MSKFNELYSFISSLRIDEIKIIRKYLPQEYKLLFESIVRKQNIKLELYKSNYNLTKLDKHSSKVYNHLLEILSNGSYNDRPCIYSDTNFAKMKIRKDLLKAQYLGSSGRLINAINIYKKNVAIAKKYEIYDELLIILYDLENLYSLYMKIDDFIENRKEIESYENIRTYYKKATYLYNKNGIERSTISDTELIDYNHVNELKELAALSNSSVVKWLYYRQYIEYLMTKQEFIKADNVVQEQLNHIECSPPIKSNVIISITYKLLAIVKLGMHDYSKALLFVSKAKELDKISSHNYVLLAELEFFIYFYKGDYAKALKITQVLFNTESTFYHAKYTYYESCCLFLEKNALTKMYELDATKEIEKHKDAWNIHIRVFLIMHYIENNRTDIASTHIESLRKHIERTGKNNEISSRLFLISKILRELAKNNFDFAEALRKKSELINSISTNQNLKTMWKTRSPELIRFDVWFEAKARRLPYQTIFNKRIESMRLLNIEKGVAL